MKQPLLEFKAFIALCGNECRENERGEREETKLLYEKDTKGEVKLSERERNRGIERERN